MKNPHVKGPVLLVFDCLLGRVRRVQRQFTHDPSKGGAHWHIRTLAEVSFDVAGEFDFEAVEKFRREGA